MPDGVGPLPCLSMRLVDILPGPVPLHDGVGVGVRAPPPFSLLFIKEYLALSSPGLCCLGGNTQLLIEINSHTL